MRDHRTCPSPQCSEMPTGTLLPAVGQRHVHPSGGGTLLHGDSVTGHDELALEAQRALEHWPVEVPPPSA